MVRIATAVRQAIQCVTPAGSQSARCGGTTQAPAAVSTRITPLLANTICASSWLCGSISSPRG